MVDNLGLSSEMGNMKKRLVFIVEGNTEVAFIHERVIPYLMSKGYRNEMNAQKITTNRQLNKKGGVASFKSLSNEVKKVAAQRNVLITTLLDFFRLPNNFPNYTTDSKEISVIEHGIRHGIEGVYPSIFYPYIQRHELETLMYTSMDGFEIVCDEKRELDQLRAIVESYDNPEDINSGAETSPSKRLIKIFPKYEKVLYGELIFEALEIDAIRARCPRFNDWIQGLEDGLRNGFF